MSERGANADSGAECSRLIVPRRGAQTLCEVEHGRLVELHPVPVPNDAECVTSRNGWTAWADTNDLNPIHLWHHDAEPGRDEFAPLRLPGNSGVEHLAFQGENLWIVGDRAGYLAVCSLYSPTRNLIEITTADKSISRLAFGGSNVYATSDDGQQKRLLRLSVDPTGRANVEAHAVLPWRNQDRFLDVAVGPSWVAVLESTYSFCEKSCYLCLYCPNTLTALSGSERTSVTTNSLFVYPDAGQRVEGAADWKSIAWVGDVLFLAAGPCGVGILDLRGHAPGAPLKREIRYASAPGYVERVIPCSHPGTVLAVVNTPEGQDTVTIQIPNKTA
jgi:hypothetical protein